MPKLKPCPFCGDEADWYEVRPGYGYVSCCACDASIGVIDALPKQDAIDAWNTRAERTCRMETEESCQNWNSCSECDADYYTDQPINYCPNCGAKVVKE